jgi:hypothetical protein
MNAELYWSILVNDQTRSSCFVTINQVHQLGSQQVAYAQTF